MKIDNVNESLILALFSGPGIQMPEIQCLESSAWNPVPGIQCLADAHLTFESHLTNESE